MRLSLRRHCSLLTLVLVACGGNEEAAVAEGVEEAGTEAQAAAPASTLQAISLFGEELHQQEDSEGAIAAVDALLAEAPNDVDRIIAAGRERRNFWHYRQAIELYTRAIQLAPDDWRAYRYRGHRHLSLRNFGEGIADLETARDLAPENWDVAYHLGLAYFLSGRFGDAAEEYLRCIDSAGDNIVRRAQSDDFRSCSQNIDDPESRVAMTEWAVRSLMRSGGFARGGQLLTAIPQDMPIEENLAYYHNLLLHKGVMTVDQLMANAQGPDAPYRLETVGFGIAMDMLASGDLPGATPILEQIYADPWWPGFGRIAAEVELERMGWRPTG